MVRKFITGAFLAAALLASAGAQAITYTVNLAIGVGGVTGTIDTDDTIGILATANIVDWSLLLDDGAGTFLLNGTANSQVVVIGNVFTATTTGLFFDFSSTSPFAAVDFQNPVIGSSINYFCLNDASGGCSGAPSAIAVNLTSGQLTSVQSGVTQIASAVAVPEPATWMLLIGGFAMTGAAVRRQRRAIAA